MTGPTPSWSGWTAPTPPCAALTGPADLASATGASVEAITTWQWPMSTGPCGAHRRSTTTPAATPRTMLEAIVRTVADRYPTVTDPGPGRRGPPGRGPGGGVPPRRPAGGGQPRPRGLRRHAPRLGQPALRVPCRTRPWSSTAIGTTRAIRAGRTPPGHGTSTPDPIGPWVWHAAHQVSMQLRFLPVRSGGGGAARRASTILRPGVGRVDDVVDLVGRGHVDGLARAGRPDRPWRRRGPPARPGPRRPRAPGGSPRRTAPSRPMPPNSPLGQATVKIGDRKLPPAMAWAPSPYPLRRTMVKNGTVRLAPVTKSRLKWRTWAVASASGPTMNPGVSHRKRTGRSWASHSWRNRAALSAPSRSMAPPRWAGLLATTPRGRPSTRTRAVTIPAPKPRRSSRTESVSARVVEQAADVVDPEPLLGDGRPQQALVGAGPLVDRPLEVGEVPPGQVDGVGFVLGHHVHHAVAHLDVERTDLLGPHDPEAPTLDHGRAAHADRGARGGDDHVAAAEQGGVAGEAAPRRHADQRDQAAQRAELGEGHGVQAGDDGVVGVPGTAPAALGEEDHRQPEPSDQLEDPVLLAVVLGTLGPGQHGVVVGEHRAPGPSVVEGRSPLTRPTPATSPSAGRALDQLRQRPAAALGGDGQRAVLGEAPGSHRSSMFSRAVRRPWRWRRSTTSGRPASSVARCRARTSSRSGRTASRSRVEIAGGQTAPASPVGLDHGQPVPYGHQRTHLHGQRAHDAGHRGPDHVLHLHRLEDQKRRALGHRCRPPCPGPAPRCPGPARPTDSRVPRRPATVAPPARSAAGLTPPAWGRCWARRPRPDGRRPAPPGSSGRGPRRRPEPSGARRCPRACRRRAPRGWRGRSRHPAATSSAEV